MAYRSSNANQSGSPMMERVLLRERAARRKDGNCHGSCQARKNSSGATALLLGGSKVQAREHPERARELQTVA